MSMSSLTPDASSSPATAAGADHAMALLTTSGLQLLIDSESMAQAVYLYRPLFDETGDRIIDLEIVLVNDAARGVPLADHIVAGTLASEVYVDYELAVNAADLVWRGERPLAYQIERRGMQDGRQLVVRYEVATFRVGEFIGQVSTDHTSSSQLEAADTRFRLMADASSDGLLLLNIDPVTDEILVSYANPTALSFNPLLKVGAAAPAPLEDFIRPAVAELEFGVPVRRIVNRDVLARTISVEVTFTLVDVGQVMLSGRELTSEDLVRAELERSDRVLQAIGNGSFGTIAVFEPAFDGDELLDLQLLWVAAGNGQHLTGGPLDMQAVLAHADLLQLARGMLDAGEKKRTGWVSVTTGSGEERSVEFALVVAGDRFVLEFLERTEELAVRTALTMVTATAEAHRSFLSRVSHELRSPLNVIHGYSQLLGRSRLPGVANDHVDHIERGVERMVQIVDDLLLLGQLDQGLLRLDEQMIDLNDISAEILVTASEQPWCVPGCLVPLSSPRNATVRTDRARLAAVALLLAEASIHADDVAQIEIGPFVRGTRAGLQLVVAAGAAMIDEVWYPFVGSHTIPGVGMGLAVARGLANALGVTVEVRPFMGAADRLSLVMMLNPVT
ncbi:MAG: hypothetical protein F2681_09140 [Actinobacteria bacterium]|uniref:histidine kinase n=2 Tax=freshwater metagenome TaxID=449393 RepID=A0A6J6A9B8_9ZZZZ|nr:hypothetical protein [Actinomycetota bacterium]MSW78149.1 hypothetical protein [Actinomycetota bacterium]MSZ83294.1 hypothetical protein [Actinomycetota bacterium]MTB18326.1 hypothetical protein [Actinomycetota bacterium]